MSIQIHSQISSQTILLASKIITDWSKKLNQQCKGSLPIFKVHITEHRQTNKNKTDFNLIILITSNFPTPHLLSLSSQLSTFGQKQKHFIPTHLAQITIANCIAITVIQYYLDFVTRGRGTKIGDIHVLDFGDCLRYFGAFNVTAKAQGLMENRRSYNILDGGAPFYAIYPTKQGFLAVGNLEPKFYREMVQQMGLTEDDRQFCLENQINSDSWPKMRSLFSNKFMQKSAQQWEQIMKKRDTCVTQVKNFQKISTHFLHPSLLNPKL